MFDSSSDVPSLHTEAKWKGFAVAQTHPSSIRENGRVQISDVKKLLPNSKKKKNVRKKWAIPKEISLA